MENKVVKQSTIRKADPVSMLKKNAMLIILVLVSSLQAVGAFLTLGLLVAPAATMYLLTDRATWLFWGGGLIGGLGAIAAFFLSYPLGWHLGATIIVVLGVLFLLAYIFSPRYGLLRR